MLLIDRTAPGAAGSCGTPGPGRQQWEGLELCSLAPGMSTLFGETPISVFGGWLLGYSPCSLWSSATQIQCILTSAIMEVLKSVLNIDSVSELGGDLT